MGIWRRMADVVEQKASALLQRTEDPSEALDLAYQRQLEALQRVRRNVADVLTAEKRLELQAAQLQQSQGKLQVQARSALSQGREDLARLALTRAQDGQTQIQGLGQQITDLKQQEQKLELTAQKLQAKVDAFRTQKETIKAQYSAAEASTKIGEAVTGLSEEMADVNLMVERAQEKTSQMQARSAAIDQLVDTGVLDQVGATGGDDIDRQLRAAGEQSAVDSQLEAMKRQLREPAQPAQLPSAALVVRIQGEDQYRLQDTDRQRLDQLDQELMAAVRSGDEAAYRSTLNQVLELVRSRGVKVPADQIQRSEVIIPAADTTLAEARALLEQPS